MPELALAICEGLGPPSEDVCVQPPLCRMEGFEAFNRLEPSIQVGVIQFDEIGIRGAAWNVFICKELLSPFPHIEDDGFPQEVSLPSFGAEASDRFSQGIFVRIFLKDMLLQGIEKVAMRVVRPRVKNLTEVF